MRALLPYLLTSVFFIGAMFMAFLTEGTGGNGDSIQHFLAAKYSWEHPELFFDHWSKPLYVLLASPFAQFGFTGIKVFQVIVATVTLLTTYKIAESLKCKISWAVILIMVCSPLYLILIFSGLTEPLFGLILALGVLLSAREKFEWSAMVVSFLPFVRSEGLIILGVFALFFLYSRTWRPLILLTTGHIVYSIAGALVHSDVLWVFTKIPYANASSPYGKGSLFHFTEQLPYVLGIPVFALLCIGLIISLTSMARARQLRLFEFLILGNFLAFYIAHSMFWYLGIFNSMGLKRVFIGVLPVMALIALQGLNSLISSERIPVKGKSAILGAALGLVVIFLFSSSPASVNWSNDFKLDQQQMFATNMTDEIGPIVGNERLFYNDPFVSVLLQIDPFESSRVLELSKYNFRKFRKGDMVIWDNWFSVTERQVELAELEQMPNLTLRYEEIDETGIKRYVIFEVSD